MVLWRNDDDAITTARRVLVALAQRQAHALPAADRDDLVQDALVKALRQHQLPGGTPLEIRVRVTFQDVLRDYYRKRSRSLEDPWAEPPEEPRDAELLSRLNLGEVCAAINEQLGNEILQYSLLLAQGHTAAQITDVPGWDPARVDRVRKRLRRKQGLVETMLRVRNSQRREAS